VEPNKEQRIPVKVEMHTPDHYPTKSPIYIRAVKGLHQRLRRNMGFLFMAAFMLLPFVQYEGHQAVLFDIVEQKFNIFGMTMWPQDFTIMAWILVISAYALFFVTTFYGRVWCGYLCPQTVWTFIFMWFEEKIQGNRNQRMKLDKDPWTASKLWKKSLTHFCWLAFSLLTALVFVGYFTPITDLFVDFFTFNASFWSVVFILIFMFCTYGNAGWMREIMCTHICPYARFQSAMFDKDTFTVTYDAARGENRGPRSRKDTNYKEKGLGDCIDCNLCVHVCPTGIDIRNGLQYECINCGACIDACDDTMDKMGYAKGLISYTTEHSLQGKPTKILRPKLVGYFVVLMVVCAAFGWTLYNRMPAVLDVVRDRGALSRESDEGLIENTYTLKIINKSQKEQSYALSVNGINQMNWIGPNVVTIKGGEIAGIPITLSVDPAELSQFKTDIEFKIVNSADSSIVLTQQSTFFKPR
jgi:cytochrome c oxidase accessory protein FixG